MSVPCRRRRRLLPAVGAALVTLVAAPSASADSIVHLKDHDVWVATPDGSRSHAVTTDGTADRPYLSPSQADDGTIAVGRGESILLLRQNGTVVRTLDPPALTDSVGAPVDGVPVDVAISPDGRRVAYGFARYSCPVGASCGGRSALGYLGTDGATGPDAYAAALYFRRPSWVGNTRTLLFGGYGSQVNVHDLGPGSQAVHWFDDRDTDGQADSTDLGDGELSPQGDKLAVVRGYGSSAQVRWYAVSGDAAAGPRPAVPSKLCQTSPAEGTHGPSWSPDGTALAAADPEGVHVIRGITADASACGALTAALVLPGASEPDWGPAEFAPDAAGPPVAGGATPPPTAGGPAPVVTGGSAKLVARVLRPGRLRSAVRGLRVRVTAPGPGRLQVAVLLDRRAARRLGLAGGRRGPVQVGGGAARARRAGPLTVRLAFPARAARRLVAAPTARLAVRVTFRAVAGGPPQVRTLRIVLRR